MKPARAFLFLFTVLSLFILISFLTKRSPESPLVQVDKIAPKEQLSSSSPEILPPKKDSLIKEQNETPQKSVPPRQLPVQSSTFAFSDSDSLHLNTLITKLHSVGEEKLPVRILYFGDSQIEGDRITSALRKKLQAHFGGKGPGFVSLDQYYNPAHQLIMNLSDNWNVQTFQDKEILNQSILFRNTLLTSAHKSGWFRINRIKSLDPKPDFELLKLYYLSSDSSQLKVNQSRQVLYSGSLPKSNGLKVLDFQFNQTPNDIRVNFSPSDSLTVVGLSLETAKGIFVDNIALRGLSYPTLVQSDSLALTDLLNQINPGLFVFHFGVNLVPYQSENYIYFRKHFKEQIVFLKKHCPGIPVLIIGVSDMALKQDGEFTSYPNIPQIKEIQRQIANETRSAFWDLEAFMGGPGSMISWVNAKPALGRKDYTHFTAAGAAKIGNELARLILMEFDNKKDTTWTGN